MSINDLVSSISGNVEQAEQLATAITASREQANQLNSQLMGLGGRIGCGAGSTYALKSWKKAIGQVQGLKTQLEQARTQAEAAKTA